MSAMVLPARVDGEFPFSIEDFRTIAALLRADAGIELPESRAPLAYSRLSKRLRALGLDDFRDYCALLQDPAGAEERGRMLSAMTTNLTKFFREAHHFEHLKAQVLPPLLARARRGERVRLWSAACSTGQEPYSLALTVLSLAPDVGDLDLRILATDIDPVVLATGRRGHYDDAALAGVPPSLRQPWFTPAGAGSWSVAQTVRNLITFRELNLTANTWPMAGQFQAVMCRNVVIYFSQDTQAALWERMTQRVERGGHLYIGHSERLSSAAAAAFESVGITTYKRRQGGER